MLDILEESIADIKRKNHRAIDDSAKLALINLYEKRQKKFIESITRQNEKASGELLENK